MIDDDSSSSFFTSKNRISEQIPQLSQKIETEIIESVNNNINSIITTSSFFIKLSTICSIFEDIGEIDKKLEIVSKIVSKILAVNGHLNKKINVKIEIDEDARRISKQIDPSLVNCLVYFEGTVCKISPSKPRLTQFIFQCSVCKVKKTIINDDDRYKTPEAYCRCKKHIFKINDKENILRDVQEVKIRLNESSEYFNGEVWDEDVNILMPGENIQGIGVVRIGNESKGYFMTYIEINNFINIDGIKIKKCSPNNSLIKSTNTENSEKNELTDHNVFFEMSKIESIFSILINCIFNEIYGYEEIKAGLLLALVSGSNKNKKGAINVLMIGDPGLGKSKILLKTSQAASRSIYICGNNTTTAGLTISLSVDPTTGGYAVDAGALVMADKGLCLIDEFDKIPDHRALNEVMEEGNICYNKGGIYYSLKINTSIIGATNPKGGHFDKNKSLKENVKFDNTLLSRFDLIFVMFDEYDYRKIKEIMQIKSDNIFGDLHSKRENLAQKIIDMTRNNDFFVKDNSLSEKYSFDRIKNYINFCRENVNPVLSIKAKKAIKEYYLSIRQKENVNTRTIESLIRLTEAYAKIHLRGIASEDDALFVIKLHKKTSINKKNIKKRKFIDVLKERKGDYLSKNEIEILMAECDVKKDVDSFINMLNSQGVIIKTARDKFRVDI